MWTFRRLTTCFLLNYLDLIIAEPTTTPAMTSAFMTRKFGMKFF